MLNTNINETSTHSKGLMALEINIRMLKARLTEDPLPSLSANQMSVIDSSVQHSELQLMLGTSDLLLKMLKGENVEVSIFVKALGLGTPKGFEWLHKHFSTHMPLITRVNEAFADKAKKELNDG